MALAKTNKQKNSILVLETLSLCSRVHLPTRRQYAVNRALRIIKALFGSFDVLF